MEYVYAAMLLHKAGQEINEANVKKVLEAASVSADEARIKALVAALDGVNIDEAIEKSAAMAAPAVQAGNESKDDSSKDDGDKKEDKKEEKKEDDKKSQENAAAGLGALFG